jgi:hypothetical protein
MTTTTINIDVVNNARVCDAGGGNVRGHLGDRVTWKSARHDFSLRFALLTGRGEQNWPFQRASVQIHRDRRRLFTSRPDHHRGPLTDAVAARAHGVPGRFCRAAGN